MKIRTKPSRDEPVDERYVLLSYRNGNITDPRTCPVGNMAPSHWMRVDREFPPGQPNTECACPKVEATS